MLKRQNKAHNTVIHGYATWMKTPPTFFHCGVFFGFCFDICHWGVSAKPT